MKGGRAVGLPQMAADGAIGASADGPPGLFQSLERRIQRPSNRAQTKRRILASAGGMAAGTRDWGFPPRATPESPSSPGKIFGQFGVEFPPLPTIAKSLYQPHSTAPRSQPSQRRHLLG